MKFILISILALIAFSVFLLFIKRNANQNTAIKKDYTDIVEKLQAAGFFTYVDKNKIEEMKSEILEYESLYPQYLGRYYFADAEDLAEQGVLDFIAETSPFLKMQNVLLPIKQQKQKKRKTRNPKTGEIIEIEPIKLVLDDSIHDEENVSYIRPISEDFDLSGQHYTVTIGEFTQEIWNSRMSGSQCWEGGMNHAFILVNKLLEKAESPERIYGLSGGNEGSAVFLTKQQFDIINNAPEIDDFEKPWVPYEIEGK